MGGDPVTSPAEWARCWRCGKSVRRLDPSCAHCRAPRRRLSDLNAVHSPSPSTPITRVLVFFGLMLVTSLVYGGLTSFGLHQAVTTPAIARHHLRMMAGFELMDTVLVGVALLAIGHPRSWRRVSDVPPAWLWTSAVVGIFLVVGVNRGYHTVLRGYLGVVPMRDAIVAATGITPMVLVTYCLEPALIEELFFRYVALDTLRGAMNVHAAVIVSSVMFGLAHIGVPLSIPMLTLVGVALGYARVASGRLALPMILHLLHNLVIVLVE